MRPDERSENYMIQNLGRIVLMTPYQDSDLDPMTVRRVEDIRQAWFETDLDSPIEWQLFAFLLLCWDSHGHLFEVNVPRPVWGDTGTYLDTQESVGPYRVDFMVTVKNFDKVERVAIECDGHNFHEKTKEQAAHDKKRDRYLVADGITVLRFTGSEIYADPWACCKEVMKVVGACRERVGSGPQVQHAEA
jgi:very-short-patch-repair endonuclease